MASGLLAHLPLLQSPVQWRSGHTRTCSLPVSATGRRTASTGINARHSTTIRCSAATTPDTSRSPPGFNEKGNKTLAHPDYPRIQAWWHPTRNQGTQPGDYPHRGKRRVWLLCPGCIHGCGRRHEWSALAQDLTKYGGDIVCPYCESKMRKFCPCRSIAADPKLSKEWHPSNPPATEFAKFSSKVVLWICPKGHPDYKAGCDSRSYLNSGCPRCFDERRGLRIHPVVSRGRPDLASEWDHDRNGKSADQVTLGSRYLAWWRCSRNPDHAPWQAAVLKRTLEGQGCPTCAETRKFRPRKVKT